MVILRCIFTESHPYLSVHLVYMSFNDHQTLIIVGISYSCVWANWMVHKFNELEQDFAFFLLTTLPYFSQSNGRPVVYNSRCGHTNYCVERYY